MNLFLGAHTSQAFWRLSYPGDRQPLVSLHLPQPNERAASNASDVLEMIPPRIEQCANQAGVIIDTLVFDQANRRASSQTKTRIWSRLIPPGSFCSYRENVFISSPAFTFLQLASRLSLAELIAYGHELCGTYAFDKSKPRGMTQRSVPLTTIGELARYLENASGCEGSKRAHRALPFIAEGSASPMETLDVMLLCLPYRLGGYCLKRPFLNWEIELGAHSARIAMQRTCRVDQYWPGTNLILEHQGWFDHSDKAAFSSDRARINGLKAEGYEVLEITGGIAGSLDTYEEIALHIAKVLGKRIPAYALGRTPQRLALRDTLFAWNKRFGVAQR